MRQSEQVAGRYGITMTSGRGYASLPPRIKLKDRFEASGKNKLVLLIVSDFDPEGEDMRSRSEGRALIASKRPMAKTRKCTS